ncbi:diguanylate cyclase [Xaviernesmea oryzae]|uniref:Diguanylate cyclase n=1 Tax=Xaviernesmea oryzae TaxID=464029 RepID=A0A1Q9ATM2_9HYPH|nr:DinB family protein [Xaviernesmea oryzae]OLP58772.1 diguanylate cyclase [Xaviernesmea oryzae]
MKQQFRMLAAYNAWANQRLYAAAGALDEAAYHTDKGAFFGSLHNTLTHLVVADQIWLHRFTGTGESPKSLAAIPYPDFASLKVAREIGDQRLAAYVDALDDDLDRIVTYRALSLDQTISQRLWPLLVHMFNHQTHHRGQAHATLTALGGPSLVLDIAYFLNQPEHAHLVA